MNHLAYYRILYHPLLSTADITQTAHTYFENYTAQYIKLYGKDTANHYKFHAIVHVFEEAVRFGPPCTYHTKPYEHYHIPLKRDVGIATYTGVKYAMKMNEIKEVFRYNFPKTKLQKPRKCKHYTRVDIYHKYVSAYKSVYLSEKESKVHAVEAIENSLLGLEQRVVEIVPTDQIKRNKITFAINEFVWHQSKLYYTRSFEIWRTTTSEVVTVAILTLVPIDTMTQYRHKCPKLLGKVDLDASPHYALLAQISPALVVKRDNNEYVIPFYH
jgi:hypothetical protein